ncbi:VapE domain-containing protein [Aeromonas veronii]
MKNNKNKTAGHDISSYDGQKDGAATQQVQQAARSVMQGKLLTLPDMSPTGRPIKTSSNLFALITFNGWEPRYNLMTGEAELADADGERLGGSEAGQRSALVDACQLAGVPDAVIEEHLIAICERHSYHPVRQWLERGAPWDGIPRIDAVIATLNAANPAYAGAVLHAWLVGCVAALYQPRWHSKLVPVLAGAQSYLKSAWVSRLAAVVPGSTLDCAINPDKPDDVRRAVSAWIVELAELESTTRHEAGSLKAFLTRENDSYRLPYARSMTTKKRQTSYIATVNGSDFLKDTTGNARFAVIELAAAADVEGLNSILGWSWSAGRLFQTDPEQLRQFWLEVRERYESGATWFLDDATAALAASENDAHTDKGPYYEVIYHHHLSRPLASSEWLTASELCARHGERLSMASSWGKALRLLASEGKLQSRRGRSNRTEYLLPVDSPKEKGKADK